MPGGPDQQSSPAHTFLFTCEKAVICIILILMHLMNIMFYFHFKPEKSCKALKLIWSGTPRAPPFDSPLFAAGTFSVKQAVWFKYVSVKKKSLVCVEAKVCFLHVRLS